MVLAPPSALGSAWMRRLGPVSTGFASGWMRLRGVRRRRAADRGFIVSDHADWDGLNSAISATGAERVYVTHGYTAQFSRWLAEQGYEAGIVETEFGGENLDAEDLVTEDAHDRPHRHRPLLARHRALDRQAGPAAVANQRVLRVLFGISTRLGSALPRGATVIRDREDGLTITPGAWRRTRRVIFYIHGGGFTIGSPRTHAALAGHLAAHAGMRAYLPRYRLAPEHPFPAARDDIIARYTALCETAPPAPSAATARAAASPCNWRSISATKACPHRRRSCLIGPIADLSRDPVQSHDEAPDEMLIPPNGHTASATSSCPASTPGTPRSPPFRRSHRPAPHPDPGQRGGGAGP
jgi:hypothetical protein